MLPDKAGNWLHKPTNQVIEVYKLEPVGELCFWGPDIGMSFSGHETQECWTSDEWQGHVPILRFDYERENWESI